MLLSKETYNKYIYQKEEKEYIACSISIEQAIYVIYS